MGKFFGGKKNPCFSIINSMTNFVKKIWEFFKYTKNWVSWDFKNIFNFSLLKVFKFYYLYY